jgi:hypothetical protein
MEQDDDKPIAREPWQGLLGERDAAPPALTDARIRAEARRALKSRAARWWLPASLAASFVLAVVLVQLQFGETPPAMITESDVVAPAIQTAPADAAAPAVDLPAVNERATYAAEPPGVEPSRRSAPEAPPPAQEAARAREEISNQVLTTGSRQAVPAEAARPPASDTARASGSPGALKEMSAGPRPPEDWYADIEALRAAGRHQEADAELERLEATWPGWLEKNRAQPR